MAQGQFTKQEAQNIIETFKEVFDAISLKKRPNYLGHANDVFLFLEAAQRAAPEETKTTNAQHPTNLPTT